ncbi:MAG: hypothetical protein HY705_09785 [Gemmatimonadetes bacterium]|nr:hypothetical protein [Gemmatimonadota bacterium]
MRVVRKLVPAIVVLAVVGCQQQQQAAEQAPPGPAPGTPEWKIANAESAAPAQIASGATIMDWAASEGAQPTELRAGSNGWTCFPDMANTPQNDPMCVDAQFANWANAWMSHGTPNITATGLAYMLQGGAAASNTDPFKMQPDSGQSWHVEPPHVMMVVPSVSALRGMPTDPMSGGPYVMWGGTPYAHIMMPVAAASQ